MKYGLTLPGRGPLATPESCGPVIIRLLRDSIVASPTLTFCPSQCSNRTPRFVGTATEVAIDIRQYKTLGVGYLVVDFARMSRTVEEMLQHMEAMATQVWP